MQHYKNENVVPVVEEMRRQLAEEKGIM